MCAALAEEAVPGPSTSAPCQGNIESRASSAPPPLAGIPLWDFPLEQLHDESLRHDFDQVRAIDCRQIQSNGVLSHPYFLIIKDRIYRGRTLKHKRKPNCWF